MFFHLFFSYLSDEEVREDEEEEEDMVIAVSLFSSSFVHNYWYRIAFNLLFFHQVFFIVEIIFHLQSPETQKFKLKVLGDEFEAERNEKTLKLKPKVIGCIWTNEHGTLPESSKSHFYIFYQHDWWFLTF